MEKTLILVGASVRAASQSALRAGFGPLSIDQFGDQDLPEGHSHLRVDRYPAGIATALAQSPAAPWMYTGGLENHPRLVGRLARLRPLWGNGESSLRAVRDPQRLADVLGQAGLAYPLSYNRSAAGGPLDTSGSRWLCKPLRSSGGIHVREAREADFACPPRGCYLQQYVPGTPASAVFVGWGGSAWLFGATRQLIGPWEADVWNPGPFQYAGSIGPLNLSAGEAQRLGELGRMLSRAFALVGLFGVDFICTPDELWTIEVNPRYSASVEILERATHVQAVALHAAACRGTPVEEPHPSSTGRIHGKAIVYARAAGVVPQSLSDLATSWNSGDWPMIADIPRPGEPIAAGQPVVTVFAEGDDEAEVERTLKASVLQVAALF